MGRYDDIINLPHHVSKKHPQMKVSDRAAQFAPFAALTGYGDAVAETARLTDAKTTLDEEEKALIDAKLRILSEHDRPAVAVTYFLKDARKQGGAYLTCEGALKRIDTYAKKLKMTDGTEIAFDCIRDIKSDVIPPLY